MASTSTQHPSSSLPVTNARELDDEVTQPLSQKEKTAIESASASLMCKVNVRLADMTIEWADRSNRVPSQKHIERLKVSFATSGVLSKTLENRILLGVTQAEINHFFRRDDINSLTWRADYLPNEDSNMEFVTIDWPSTSPKFLVLSGQHRKIALEQYVAENHLTQEQACWACNIYNLDTLPHALLVNLAGNRNTVNKVASSGEIFRDMAAVVSSLANSDTSIAQPHYKRIPTVQEFLSVPKQGQKSKLRIVFMENLDVCASSNGETLDKMITILASPLRDSIITWVRFGVGLEQFQVHGVHEIVMSQCYSHWVDWFGRHNRFYKKIMGTTPARYFDMDLQNELSNMQPRNEASINSLFWPDKGAECSVCPLQGQKRNMHILPFVSDDEYLAIYIALLEPDNLRMGLMSKRDFANFIKYEVSAIRSVIPQIVRWLLPSGDSIEEKNEKKASGGRFAPKKDFKEIIASGYFEARGISNPEAAAANMLSLVAAIISRYVTSFSPKTKAHLDSYPTVQTTNPTTNKQTKITVEVYMQRFRRYYAWFHLAKAVANYTGFHLEEDFMRPFNHPEHTCFVREDTSIPEDIIEGRISLQRHPEVSSNPMLNSKEGRTVLEEIRGDIRKAVVTRVSEFLTRRVEMESAHLDLSIDDRDLVLRDQANFKKLAARYEQFGLSVEEPVSWVIEELSAADKAVIESFPPPVMHGRVRGHRGMDGCDEWEMDSSLREMMNSLEM